MKRSILYLFIMFLFSNIIFSQNNESSIVKGAPNVFLKCWQCDMDRMKREVKYINYVRQRQDADIIIITTSKSTGAGGRYTVYFEGQNHYKDISDTLFVEVKDTDSEKIIDDKLMVKIKLGLLPYLVKSDLKSKITYNIGIVSDEKIEKVDDPWKSWVFTTSMNGNYSGQSSYNSLSLRGSLYANRTTEKDKWGFSASMNYRNRNYYTLDSNNTAIDSLTFTTEKRSKYFSAKYIYSLDDHWSIGVFSNAFSDTYSNYDLSARLKLGIEYNIFDFEESDRKSLVFSYQLGSQYNDYVDTTIYNKVKETIFNQALSVNLYQKQDWGNVSFGASFSNYLHNIKINELSFNTYISWNVFKGFTLNLGGSLSFINDQISLPKAEIGEYDPFLGDRLLSTNYSAYSFIGLSYTFGSKYANAVNSRFSSGGSTTYYFF